MPYDEADAPVQVPPFIILFMMIKEPPGLEDPLLWRKTAALWIEPVESLPPFIVKPSMTVSEYMKVMKESMDEDKSSTEWFEEAIATQAKKPGEGTTQSDIDVPLSLLQALSE